MYVRHGKDAHNGRPIFINTEIPKGQVIPYWRVRIGEAGQDVGVFKMRCVDMLCGSWNAWIGNCTKWMNDHHTFGGGLTIPEVENALRAVVKAFGGEKKFRKYYSDHSVNKREKLDVPVYEAECLVATLKWAEGAALLQKGV